LQEFLEHVSLVSDADSVSDDDMMSIMTLHASKGLEFDTVFLAGWEEGLFPHQRSLDEKGTSGLEEERRLAYVGITRAKRLSIISHASNRRIYNQWQSSVPSRFLGELPEEHVKQLDGGAYTSRSSGPALFQKEIENVLAESERVTPKAGFRYPPKAASPSNNSGKDSNKDDNTTIAVGKRIFHIKFGYGIVRTVHGDHLDIMFDKAGRKKLLAEYVKPA